ncbi:UDP-4-amino-4,6-dideoxy-N-acetyl-beta-L-altrosamine transaminase [Desulfovibrio psychrotolerans]|uniref:UDP-4-amino-4,6-dideoxy-N-acetyl-beta-L-altrosami ne transaminase n=1 Tax=Desulfovibrio psychrotolerans TaxID=415242 RepID=A0A7J0BWL7_9BACT|nr:UDP-4-amino-4,6-dideoxy-N-acetyl-beta-L-altrosamine transaminase [Desulfovibrio psychrotolerans]GFM38116.1 UDP-4-amino-4,6-dideoxy-N-acetyl-beta-L-altrosami ne transaminase [Desulfovibrio psychrotolerans]
MEDNRTFIPYGRQHITDEDIAAVTEALRSDWLTTGPRVGEFEQAVCTFTGARHGVAVCNGTAALHAAMFALGIGPGDEVIVSPMTFAATANCVLYMGGTPVFADVEPDTLLIDPQAVRARITPATRAIIGVDYAGQPCDWDALRAVADEAGVALVADGCHAIGGTYRGRSVGTLADMTVFSFHPVKHVATGEGGMIMTDSDLLAARLRLFRNHGISTDHRQREAAGSWAYDMVELGYNYRITDIQCALGISQLKRLPHSLERRRAIAAQYDAAFAGTDISPCTQRPDRLNAYHLYAVQLPEKTDRAAAFAHMRANKIGVNVHYIPVHLHPYYRTRLGTAEGLCPVAEKAYNHLLSLPMFPELSEADVDRVVKTLLDARGA